MVMHFFASPKGVKSQKHSAVVIGDDESLDSVSLNGGENANNVNSSSNQDSYNFPDKSETSLNHMSFHESGGIDAKLLKEERNLQKMIAKQSKDKPLDKKVQKATDKRREAILKEKVKAVTHVEQDLINQCLGADEDGYCLRHQDQKVRMGIVQPSYRFETISLCQSCAFGAASGIEVKNHGQKDKTISHAVKGALVATGIKQKKTKIKGAFAANMNPSSPRVDLLAESIQSSDGEVAHRAGGPEFSSSDALHAPSGDEPGTTRSQVSPHSRSNLEKDTRWMEEVQVRVLQVNSWDNNTAPLKCHPNFAKYFRMISTGIPVEEIKEMTGEHGPDLLVLSLDPEKSLNDQMNSLPTRIQERLRSNEALIVSKSVQDDETRTVELVYQSYLTQLHVFEAFLQEDQAGIDAMRQSIETNESEVSPMTDPDTKKKKKLRLSKKFKRLMGAATGTHAESVSTDDDASESENVDHSESHSGHQEDNPVPARSSAVVPVPLQPLPAAGLRRARRPTAAGRRPRKPAAPSTAEHGVVQTTKTPDAPASPLTPSSELADRKTLDNSLDSNIMDSIMSASTAEDIMEDAELILPPLPKEAEPEAEEEVANPAATSAAPMVIKSFPSRPKADSEETPPPVMVIKTFPSRAKEPTKEEEKETAPPVMVLKSFPSAGKRAANASKEKQEDKKANDPLATSDKKNEEEDKEAERKKREEMRKAVEALHQFKLGSYDDSFGSIPTTVLPDLCPTTGEPSIHSHLSSISSHSSDATDSEEESESDSDDDDDEDDDDDDDDEHDEDDEHEEKETVEMDEYIHLQDKMIDLNAELFEAKYLLENSQKREEALIEANKAKDRKIELLAETVEAMQVHINTLSAQNAEAGKIMMELTATIEENKRQKLFRRLSIASASAESDIGEESLPGSQHQRFSGGPMRRKSGSQHSGYYRRASGSMHSKRLSTENDEIPEMTPMMVAVSSSMSIPEFDVSDVRDVPPSASSTPSTLSNARKVPASSNVRQIAPKAPSNIRELQPKATSNIRELPAKKSDLPSASNIREIAPSNRVRAKEASSEAAHQEVASNPIVPAPTSEAPQSQPRVITIRSFQPSSKLEERRRRKRELEERLKISVARTHSEDVDDMGFASGRGRTEIKAGGGDEEEV